MSYLIRGIPVPDGVLRNVSLPELQSFAADVAQHVAASQSDVFRAGGQARVEGAVISVGGYLTIGFPPPENFLLTE